MPSLNWSVFESLPGSKSQNFEQVCRRLIWLHYAQFGTFKELPNQPGVEFHIDLFADCVLGSPPRHLGWQCKFPQLRADGKLKSATRQDIESSLKTTENHLPELTDWILWTPFTLVKNDQQWFYGLTSNMNLQLWTLEQLDAHLIGPGLCLRNTYFGELILTPQNLSEQHRLAIQPIRERWLQPVHQQTDAERKIRQMLGEQDAWTQVIKIGKRLRHTEEKILQGLENRDDLSLKNLVETFVAACRTVSNMLFEFREILTCGDLDIIHQTLAEQNFNIDVNVRSTPRLLRRLNLPIALYATNALVDIWNAQNLLDEVVTDLKVGLVAVLADAGGGKTQTAAEITAPKDGRPAGIFLHGKDLHQGQKLNDLAKTFSINGSPLDSIEDMLSALDAAGKREACRLPVLIDGLSEAEDPRNWKSELSRLSQLIKNYPNVLVVCTLRTGERKQQTQLNVQARESFAEMSLPNDVRRIQSEGFGNDTRNAVDRYFNHFKIRYGEAELPLEFLQHPLNLRIFCEVANPKRKSEVTVDHFLVSLALLFDKYVSNACKRIAEMTNLSYPYTVDEVKNVVYKLGIRLWKNGKREIDDESFRNLISDSVRPWNSSIVNLLAQEGIIFRNPSHVPGRLTISPVYDALGGHIVVSALLSKYALDTNFDWLKKKKAIDSFLGENSHELASNIFTSLIALTPSRTHGTQLWKVAPDCLKKEALIDTPIVEAQYIDSETVDELSKFFENYPEKRNYLFAQLKKIRAIANHPLNANFLDRLLRKMSIADRDLSWTEWTRKSQSDRLDEIIEMEHEWKNNSLSRTTFDRLRAKWIMWFLTSTVRELRDVTTRALYWYGRGAPEKLFKESIISLGINDPYIPERMLAASYGVAMACQTDLNNNNFINRVLPNYAKSIYDRIFAIGATFGTTHILFREYAYRTIEMASLHNNSMLTKIEQMSVKPPFSCGGSNDWGEFDEETRLRGYDSPLYMDFENYTIGSLVPGRGNYDFEHKEYRKVRAQILWRVKQLGWSSDRFGEIDNSISKSNFRLSYENKATKIDRYGKKYSWIAYFEMSGVRHDSGVLKNWAERISRVDIDPSFPERTTKGNVIDTDYLGDGALDMSDWLNSEHPNVKPYLRLDNLQNEPGIWIALDGHFAQEDKVRGRSMFCFVRSLIVAKKDVESLVKYLSQMYVGGDRLPDKPSVSFTYADEVPWCEAFPETCKSKLPVVIDEFSVEIQKKEYEFFLDGERLEVSNFDLNLLCQFGHSKIELEKNRFLTKDDLKRIKVGEVPVIVTQTQKVYQDYDVIIPVCDYDWASCLTVTNDGLFATVLAKEIALNLELIGRPQSFDMYTADRKRATINISDHNDDPNNYESMFYVREDLMKSYLKSNDLTLIWAMWGERQYSSNLKPIVDLAVDHERHYAKFSTIECYSE